MSRIDDHRIGITPILLRRAGYYLGLGFGTYYPDHPHFDKVVVDKLYPITQNPANPNEWSLGSSVSFFFEGRRIRWVEFGCRLTGAGGDEILKLVE